MFPHSATGFTARRAICIAAALVPALVLLILFAPPRVAMGQVSYVSLSTPYTQNFDTLSNTGTISWFNNSTLVGWYAAQQNGTLSTYRADYGGSNTGALYSYGSTGSMERALGSVSSSTPGTIYYGVRMRNDTGLPIAGFVITYTGEQWRNGGNTNQQKLAFAYQTSTTITSLTAGTWVTAPVLDFISPITNGVAITGAIDGNTITASAILSSFICCG
jgi:hypothetical protein